MCSSMGLRLHGLDAHEATLFGTLSYHGQYVSTPLVAAPRETFYNLGPDGEPVGVRRILNALIAFLRSAETSRVTISRCMT
jgi:hypothetical protein